MKTTKEKTEHLTQAYANKRPTDREYFHSDPLKAKRAVRNAFTIALTRLTQHTFQVWVQSPYSDCVERRILSRGEWFNDEEQNLDFTCSDTGKDFEVKLEKVRGSLEVREEVIEK
jgi:hypothetical protein